MESAAPETVRLLLLLLGAVVVPDVVASPDELLLEAGVLAEDELELSVVPVDGVGAAVVVLLSLGVVGAVVEVLVLLPSLGVEGVVGAGVVVLLSLGVAGVVEGAELSVVPDVLGVDDAGAAAPLVGGIRTVSIA